MQITLPVSEINSKGLSALRAALQTLSAARTWHYVPSTRGGQHQVIVAGSPWQTPGSLDWTPATHTSRGASAESTHHPCSSEPAAVSALALQAWGMIPSEPLNWLCKLQQSSGCVAVNTAQQEPGWTTGWAVLAWQAAITGVLPHLSRPASRVMEAVNTSLSGRQSAADQQRTAWEQAAKQGLAWLLAAHGEAVEQGTTAKHNGSLVGWSWVDQTHSWLEPTSLALLALAASQQTEHARYQEGIAMLKDRLIPSGGANYGNTMVLGQWLRPHLQPTGLALWGLGPAASTVPELRDAAVAFLLKELPNETAPASLAYAALGLAAQGVRSGSLWPQLLTVLESRPAEEFSAYHLGLLLFALAAHAPSLPDEGWSAPGATLSTTPPSIAQESKGTWPALDQAFPFPNALFGEDALHG